MTGKLPMEHPASDDWIQHILAGIGVFVFIVAAYYVVDMLAAAVNVG